MRDYLGKAFEGYNISESQLSPSVRTIKVEREGRIYQLDVDDTFLETSDVAGELNRLAVRDELCRAEGLPLVLTGEGIRLASSN